MRLSPIPLMGGEVWALRMGKDVRVRRCGNFAPVDKLRGRKGPATAAVEMRTRDPSRLPNTCGSAALLRAGLFSR